MATWAGAPPVSREGFTFINNEFFAETANQNRHRRATPAELKALFDTPGSDKDKPAHWFEAQLIHYSLPVSKTKSVAWKRLFDAVREDKLAVPPAIKRLETDMKKEWTKNDRELKKGSAATPSTPAAGKGKRKADDGDVAGAANAKKAKTVVAKEEKPKPAAKPSTAKAVAGTKSVVSTPKKAAEKKPVAKKPAEKKPAEKKPAAEKKPTEKKPTEKKVTEKKPAAEKKQTAKRGGITPSRGGRGGISQSAAASSPERAPAPKPLKTTARCTGRGGMLSYKDNRYDKEPSPETYPGPVPPHLARIKQTARRSRGWDRNRGRIHSTGQDDDSDPPPPYSEFSLDDGYNEDGYDDDDDDAPPAALAPLGLLNGHYTLTSPSVTGNWSQYGEDFDLSLVISGQDLWGSFDLGIISGVLHFETRPYQSSYDEVEFTWRGREQEGQIHYGFNNTGWIKFLGNGSIFGQLDWQRIEFSGTRDPGQGTRSDVDVRALRDEWDEYSEEQYERENRSRWGRSSGW
jgi:hypothetical protein